MPSRIAQLPALLSELPPGMLLSAVPAIPVSGIAIDSRRVEPGDLFVALHGASTDGHAFARDALERGAAAVVGEAAVAPAAAPYAQLKSTREALSWIAAAFHGWPARQLMMIGVTGTDGKTTTANMIFRILREAGLRSGLISTVNAVIGNEEVDTGFHVTTPDAHDVQAYLRKMVDAGLTHAVLETTSHGWAQHRVDACDFDIGVVTNITHEHLDEHGSYENYRAAKGRLFASLETTAQKPSGNPRLAVLNRDDRSYEYLSGLAKVGQVSYGIDSAADLTTEDLRSSGARSNFVATHRQFRVAIDLPLPGAYNVANCLAAIGATVLGAGVSARVAAEAIANVAPVPGRMERIDVGQDFIAIVDFAHTPNALRSALMAAREILARESKPGRLITVFGSAGLRDRAKRRMMAETAAELADMTILTAEDPRTESLDHILSEMAEGALSRGGEEGRTFWRVPDRGEAIRLAVQKAAPGDLVISCGKGHEQSMCFGAVEHPWDDRTALRAALCERLGLSGPRIPYLPTQDQAEAQWLQAS